LGVDLNRGRGASLAIGRDSDSDLQLTASKFPGSPFGVAPKKAPVRLLEM